LLDADEIGITLSEEEQLDEQSTSAPVVHHPQAN
jgi:cobalamin-dependent methionine synthase I